MAPGAARLHPAAAPSPAFCGGADSMRCARRPRPPAAAPAIGTGGQPRRRPDTVCPRRPEAELALLVFQAAQEHRLAAGQAASRASVMGAAQGASPRVVALRSPSSLIRRRARFRPPRSSAWAWARSARPAPRAGRRPARCSSEAVICRHHQQGADDGHALLPDAAFRAARNRCRHCLLPVRLAVGAVGKHRFRRARRDSGTDRDGPRDRWAGGPDRRARRCWPGRALHQRAQSLLGAGIAAGVQPIKLERLHQR